MKIIYFVQNGNPSQDDKALVEKMRVNGDKVYFSNGSALYGFEDSCGAVFLSKDFPHIEKWAVSKGIEVMKPEPETAAAAEPESVKEVKTDADALSEDAEKQEEKAEEEVKPRRQRRTKPAADDVV